MSKWADWCIEAVRYSRTGERIEAVRARPDNGVSIGSPSVFTRDQVVKAIRFERTTFVTIYQAPDGNWKLGAKVDAVEIDGEYFLRTDPNRTKRDNLGNLPTF